MPLVAWTPRSREDLQDIRNFIRFYSPLNAERFIRKLMASTSRLRKHPLLGEVVHELRENDVREILFGNYRIIYRVKTNRVDILRVYHSARLLDEGILD